MTNNLKPGERLDDLQIKGYEIIQSPGRFCFGMDAVLLSAFAKVKAGECVLDLGTGTGILPILLAAKTKGKHFTGLEITDIWTRFHGCDHNESAVYDRWAWACQSGECQGDRKA